MQKAAAEESAPAVDSETAKFAEIGRAFAGLMAACGGAKVDLSAVKPVDVVLPKTASGSDKSAAPKADAAPSGTSVPAPLNGTFYRSAGPGKPELAKDGDAVKSGDAVCIVEAMKLFNPIKAPAAGKITFLVQHGAAVTKGQKLAVIA
jgi:acetyl-CoA carboxylase biotin carboxyl carrier protein